MTKDHFDINDKYLYLCLLVFQQDKLPDMYLIAAGEWKNENDLLRNRDYDKPD